QSAHLQHQQRRQQVAPLHRTQHLRHLLPTRLPPFPQVPNHIRPHTRIPPPPRVPQTLARSNQPLAVALPHVHRQGFFEQPHSLIQKY
ncbi:unnamed protein product, partial [Closterium sp. NIES-54]